MKKRFHLNQSNQIPEPFGKRAFFTQLNFVENMPIWHLLLQITTGFIILAFIGACGSGGGSGSGSSADGDGTKELIAINYPTTDARITEYCDEVTLEGEINFIGPPGPWSTADFDCNSKWENKTTGDSGYLSCRYTGYSMPNFNYTFYADAVPLAIGDNLIVVDTYDPVGNYGSDSLTVTKPALTYNISGSVFNTNGNALGCPNMEMHLKGENTESYAAVESDGSYSFTCIPDGSYTITLESTINYNYEPSSHTVFVNNGDVSGVDFVVEAYFITGGVVTTNGDAIGYGEPNIEMLLKGENIESYPVVESDGSYLFTCIPDGSYTITLELPMDYNYEPKSHTVYVNNEDVSGVDFVVEAYFIHGRVESCRSPLSISTSPYEEGMPQNRILVSSPGECSGYWYYHVAVPNGTYHVDLNYICSYGQTVIVENDDVYDININVGRAVYTFWGDFNYCDFF